MAALSRVAFRFPTHTEVRYLEHIPVRGQRVTRPGDGSWLVARVESDNEGGYTITCLQPRDIVRETRSTCHAMRALARDLRDRTRETASRTKEQRARVLELMRGLGGAR